MKHLSWAGPRRALHLSWAGPRRSFRGKPLQQPPQEQFATPLRQRQVGRADGVCAPAPPRAALAGTTAPGQLRQQPGPRRAAPPAPPPLPPPSSDAAAGSVPRPTHRLRPSAHNQPDSLQPCGQIIQQETTLCAPSSPKRPLAPPLPCSPPPVRPPARAVAAARRPLAPRPRLAAPPSAPLGRHRWAAAAAGRHPRVVARGSPPPPPPAAVTWR
jgi:hypothetical protein